MNRKGTYMWFDEEDAVSMWGEDEIKADDPERNGVMPGDPIEGGRVSDLSPDEMEACVFELSPEEIDEICVFELDPEDQEVKRK